MKSFRVMPIHVGGIRNTSEKEYAQNLDTLVRALKERAPKAKLVWASTTPIFAPQQATYLNWDPKFNTTRLRPQ